MAFWRRPALGLLVLAALAGAPVLAAVCAGLCAPHRSPVEAQHAAASCHESAVSGTPALAETDPDSCGGHDQTVHDPATLRSARGSESVLVHALSGWMAPGALQPAAVDLRARRPHEAAPPPPRSTLVLRI